MKISGFNFQHKIDYKNNQYDYSSQYNPILRRQPEADTFSRSSTNITRPSFTAKEEQVSREPLVKLYKEHLTCLCCGREMIDPKIITEMEDRHVFACPTKEAIKVLDEYEHTMHTVEKDVFKLLKEQAKISPNKTIKEHIIELKKTHEYPLIQKQAGIFKLIDKYAEKIKPELHAEIRKYLLESFNTIKEGDNNFSRIRFINGLQKILENYPNTANKENLIRLAGKLPTAYDDVDAFIVKYANPKYKSESIAVRLLSYSMATIEHIHPQDSKDVKGPNHLHNYVPECMRCNSFRSNKPMIYQLQDYPEMFINAQKAFDRLIGFANNGRLSKMYIIKLYKALRHESEGVLDLDYSKLHLNKQLIAELNRPFSYPVSPDKAAQGLKPEILPEPQALPIILNEESSKVLMEKILKERNPKINAKPEQFINISPLISKKKRKRLVAEENNPQARPKVIVQKNKKPKVEKKDTIKRGSHRR